MRRFLSLILGLPRPAAPRLEGLLDHPSHRASARAHRAPLPPHAHAGRRSRQLHRPRQRRQPLHPLRERPPRGRRPRPRRPDPLALRALRPGAAAPSRRQPDHRNRVELRRLRADRADDRPHRLPAGKRSLQATRPSAPAKKAGWSKSSPASAPSPRQQWSASRIHGLRSRRRDRRRLYDWTGIAQQPSGPAWVPPLRPCARAFTPASTKPTPPTPPATIRGA
jgi:hypothetical protein